MERANTPAPEWGIVAASLRQPNTRDALARQDGLYTLLERGPSGTSAEIIGAIRAVLFAHDQRAELMRAFAQAKIVTITVTASGYGLDPATGRMSPQNSDIKHDIDTGLRSSTLGVLVEGLRQTRARGARPPVILCCDNLPGNGRVLRAAAVDYAALFDDGLSEWIAREVQFPCSMVDRIAPAVNEFDRIDASMILGLEDSAPVVTEPFSQWVIEDFEGPRPMWDAAGALFVSDVAEWETSKLRMLNGAHLALAYLGALAGYASVADTMSSPVFTRFCRRLMLREQGATLRRSPQDLAAYANELIERWSNPGMSHQLSRIGRDGSDKLDARLLAPAAENLAAGREAPCANLALAAWICCLTGRVGLGAQLAFEDPLRARMQELGADRTLDTKHLVIAALSMMNGVAAQLRADPNVVQALADAVCSLQLDGPETAMLKLLQPAVASAA